MVAVATVCDHMPPAPTRIVCASRQLYPEHRTLLVGLSWAVFAMAVVGALDASWKTLYDWGDEQSVSGVLDERDRIELRIGVQGAEVAIELCHLAAERMRGTIERTDGLRAEQAPARSVSRSRKSRAVDRLGEVGPAVADLVERAAPQALPTLGDRLAADALVEVA